MSGTLTAETQAGLLISIRFVTERCVATSVSSRDEPEWPPHPGRIFMAMAAAFFESEGTDKDKEAERNALDWLSSLVSAPEIRHCPATLRSEYTCYVPVNDNQTPNKAMLQSAPGMPRSRQPRTFPTVIPELNHDTEAHVQLVWNCGEVPIAHREAIDRICRNVIRVGHSSSLVMMWADGAIPNSSQLDRFIPSDDSPQHVLRVATSGELGRLERSCQAGKIDLFADLAERISTLKGKEKTEAKAEFEKKFGEPFKQSLRPPEPLPPTIGFWQGYRRHLSEVPTFVENSYFERELLIFEVKEGPSLNVERVLGLTRALRNKAMSACPIQPPPEWLSGHAADGSSTTSPHAAFVALPFARSKWADGHIMGVAIALPKGISVEERGKCLAPLIVDQNSGELQEIDFRLWGRDLPDLVLRLCNQSSPPTTLKNETWTAPSYIWASVTPVVLDKFPKSSMQEERSNWQDEVRRIIATSCERAGLPIPTWIHVGTTAFHQGVGRATVKRRQHGSGSALGDGFPPFAAAKDLALKPQLHVRLEFDQPVAGPVLIGAGRFAGYGLCLPVIETH